MQRRLASEQGLVLAPPPPALTKRSTGLTYIRGALASPLCVAVAVFTGCLGLGFAGIIGALIAIVATAMLGSLTTRYQFVRRHLAPGPGEVMLEPLHLPQVVVEARSRLAIAMSFAGIQHQTHRSLAVHLEMAVQLARLSGVDARCLCGDLPARR